MSIQSDISLIKDQPKVVIHGNDLDQINDIVHYKGKFLQTTKGHFFAKLISKTNWDRKPFFHDEILRDMEVENPTSMQVSDIVPGGGKMEVVLEEGFIQVHLYGKSTIYGDFDEDLIPLKSLEMEIQEVFEVDDLPVTISFDHEV